MDTSSFKDILTGGVVDIYSGVQPATADAVPNGTKLVTISTAAGAYTPEVRGTGTITLTGGAGGNTINSVTVNSINILETAVAFTVSLTDTATALASALNASSNNPLYTATASGAVITLTTIHGLGTSANTWVVAAGLTGFTATFSNITGGVAAVNGLRFSVATAGALPKHATDVWQGTVNTSGIAGWFRFREGDDTGALASTTAARLDGSIGTSGADMNLGSLSLTATAPFIIPAAAFTIAQA